MAPVRTLTLQDRCDRCGAQAFARTLIKESELLFCGHHFTEHEKALRLSCDEVHDHRGLINKEASISATPA